MGDCVSTGVGARRPVDLCRGWLRRAVGDGPADPGRRGRPVQRSELDAHHWLGHRLTGQVLRYVAVLDGEWVALVGFGSAALSCAAPDRFLGWSREAQYARLRHVVNNQRFCVLPVGGRPNLASAVLARVLRRLAGDYPAVYGHRVLAVEAFTHPARPTGACYAAANFGLLGETLGYARSAGRSDHHGSRQRVWVYLLHRDAPAILAAAYPHPLLAPRGGVDVHTVALAGASGLLGLLEGPTDPRQKRGIRHRVAAVRTMVAAATLAGATSFRSVADYIADLPPERSRGPTQGRMRAAGRSAGRCCGLRASPWSTTGKPPGSRTASWPTGACTMTRPSCRTGGFRPARRAWSLPGRPSSTFRLGPGRRQLAPRAGAPWCAVGCTLAGSGSADPRPVTGEQVRQALALLTRPENSVAAIARLLGVSRSTLCTHIPDLAGGRWPAIEALQPTRSKGDV